MEGRKRVARCRHAERRPEKATVVMMVWKTKERARRSGSSEAGQTGERMAEREEAGAMVTRSMPVAVGERAGRALAAKAAAVRMVAAIHVMAAGRGSSRERKAAIQPAALRK